MIIKGKQISFVSVRYKVYDNQRKTAEHIYWVTPMDYTCRDQFQLLQRLEVVVNLHCFPSNEQEALRQKGGT